MQQRGDGHLLFFTSLSLLAVAAARNSKSFSASFPLAQLFSCSANSLCAEGLLGTLHL